MDLTAKARARPVCLLSTSVQSLQVAGFGFILLTGQLHTPFLLLFPGPSNSKAPQAAGVSTQARGETCLVLGWLIPSAAVLSFPSLILWMLSKLPVLLVLEQPQSFSLPQLPRMPISHQGRQTHAGDPSPVPKAPSPMGHKSPAGPSLTKPAAPDNRKQLKASFQPCGIFSFTTPT